MTLAETQNTIQRCIVIAIVSTIFFYIAKFGLGVVTDIYDRINPPKKPDPVASFGMLPQLKMTTKTIKGGPKYTLETTNKTLPKFNDRANVYKFIEAKSAFSSEDQINNLTKKLGFTGDPIKPNPAERIWNDGSGRRTFQSNVVNKNFTMTTNIGKISTIIGLTSPVTTNDAKSAVSNFIKSNGIMDTADQENMQFDFVLTDVRVNKFVEDKISNGKARIVKVNVHRYVKEGTNSYKIYANNAKDSLVSAYATNAKSPENFVQLNVTYWPVDYTAKSEYYLSPISQVWEAIVQGKGIIADVKAKQDDYYDFTTIYEIQSIDILTVKLGYYESKEFIPYLQPIYVFEGVFKTKPLQGQLSKEGQITLYFPAVRGDFVKQD